MGHGFVTDVIIALDSFVLHNIITLESQSNDLKKKKKYDDF
jgi:hypothetical protein